MTTPQKNAQAAKPARQTMNTRQHDTPGPPAHADRADVLDRRAFLRISALALLVLASLSFASRLCGQATPASAAAAAPAARLTILGDNTEARSGVKAVWGFACLVEARGHTVLFDTGADPTVLKDNLAAMKVDPAKIEAVVISHFHPDHTWGAPGLGKLAGVRVFTPRGSEDFGKLRSAGLKEDVARNIADLLANQTAKLTSAGLELVAVSQATPLFDGIAVSEPLPFGEIPTDTPGKGFTYAFWEQCLTVDTPDGLVVIVGCSHPGIVAMLEQVKRQTGRPLYLVIGGFHLLEEREDAVRQIATAMQAMGVAHVSPTHCTGEAAVPVFRDVFGDRCVTAGVGAVIDLPIATTATSSAQQPNQPAASPVVRGKSAGPLIPGGDPTVQIRPEAIRAHLEFLADDLLEGRGTGSRGHKLAVNYIRAQCEAAGLHGAGDGGGYFQKVLLVRTAVDDKETTLELKGSDGTRSLVYGTDFVILDTHRDTEGGGSGELVFAGDGVTAPEQGYDDYAGLNVKGKIAVMLAFEAPASFAPAVRAYYSDGDVKRANAVAHGAVGVLYISSPTQEKRLPWQFLLRELRIGFNSKRWLGPDGRPGGLDDSLKVCGGFSRSGAEALFAGEKCGLDEVFAATEKGTPPRFALSKSATIRFRSRHEKLESDNVVAVLEGSDPVLKNEYVLYSTHVDHLGIGDTIDGDSIYNGAMDNAGGCAVLLEVARSFDALRERPRRSVVFLFVTGEEAGLLGSDYFACHPTIPLGQIVANINFDGGTSLTPVSDVIAWGAEHSSLQAAVQHAADQTPFTVSPDPFPEEGFFVRSDQFSFVKKGIPAIFVDVGVKSTQPGVDGLAILKQWLVTVYHSPKDDLAQPIQYETSARFAQFVFRLGYAISMDSERPQWNDNDFFGRKFGSVRR
jgi:metal-dependent hydrolase (beta-lactamase superfamily II)